MFRECEASWKESTSAAVVCDGLCEQQQLAAAGQRTGLEIHLRVGVDRAASVHARRGLGPELHHRRVLAGVVRRGSAAEAGGVTVRQLDVLERSGGGVLEAALSLVVRRTAAHVRRPALQHTDTHARACDSVGCHQSRGLPYVCSQQRNPRTRRRRRRGHRQTIAGSTASQPSGERTYLEKPAPPLQTRSSAESIVTLHDFATETSASQQPQRSSASISGRGGWHGGRSHADGRGRRGGRARGIFAKAKIPAGRGKRFDVSARCAARKANLHEAP